MLVSDLHTNGKSMRRLYGGAPSVFVGSGDGVGVAVRVAVAVDVAVGVGVGNSYSTKNWGCTRGRLRYSVE